MSIHNPAHDTSALSQQGPGHGMAIGSLLIGAGLWGCFWIPLRWLEQVGLHGLWSVVFIYLGASLVGLVVARHHLGWVRRHPERFAGIALTSALSGTAFSLGMIEGEVARVMLFFYLSPLWSVIMARLLLREPLTRQAMIALVLSITGALVMLWPTNTSLAMSRADVLGLLAGMAFAATNIQVRYAYWMPLRIKTLAAWSGAPLLAAGTAGGLGIGLMPDPWTLAVALMVGMTIMTTMTLTVQVGVTWLPVRQSSVILIFELIAGAVSAAWLAGEMLATREWMGGLLIVCGGLIAGWRRRQDH
jgi:drug/metabolite transporter (DMT)-like permease